MDTDEFGDEYVEKLKVYLVNNSNAVYKFDYKLTFFGDADFELKNTVQPFENFYIHDVDFSDMSDSPAFEFDFSLPVAEKNKADHFESVIKLKPKQLFNRIEELKKKMKLLFRICYWRNTPTKPRRDKIAAG